MFEALFILTTIDTGTRIARFLVQEAMGRVHPELGRTDWLPGAIVATAAVTAGWGLLVYTGSIDTIWPMFGIANQLARRRRPGAGDDAARQYRAGALRAGDGAADAVRDGDDDDGGDGNGQRAFSGAYQEG